MADAYPSGVVTDWLERFGSIDAAEAHALTVPGFGDELRRIDQALRSVVPRLATDPEPPRDRELRAQRRALVIAALGGEPTEGGHAKRAARESPGPDPDDFELPVFREALKRILNGEELAVVERGTGLSHRKVIKLRDWIDHPGRPGLRGGPGYILEPGRIANTVRLRRL